MSTGCSTKAGVLAVFLLLRTASAFAVEAFVPMHAAKLIAAAEKGDPECQYRLAQHYENGEGPVIESGPDALIWYRKAAEQGYTEAEWRLGELFVQVRVIYLNGEPLSWYPKQDLSEGMRWLKIAAGKGHAVSQHLISQVFLHGSGILKSDAEYLVWLRKAAGKDSSAAGELSRVYQKGVLAPENAREATFWEQKAKTLSEQEKAQIADLRRKGRLSGSDLWQAEAKLSVNYYVFQAGKNNAQAQHILSQLLFKGNGIRADSIEAYKWALLAVTQGHPVAKREISYIEIQLSPTERTEGQRRSRSFVMSK
jgi:TPR repeat protein